MESILNSYIEELIYFKLRVNPDLSVDNIQKSVVDSIIQADLIDKSQESIEKIIEEKKDLFCQHGVLNPFLLSNKRKVTPHFFFFNAEAGWFEYLLNKIKEVGVESSQYTLYGESDLLIIVWCTEEEAQEFKKKFEPSYVDVKHASIKSTHIFYNYPVNNIPKNVKIDESLVNKIITTYDHKLAEENRLLENKVILGPTWEHCKGARQGVSAFIGISTMGHNSVSYYDVLNELKRNELIEKSIVDFYEVDRGSTNFRYIVKVVCKTMDELDTITNKISFIRITGTKFEGITFIVAQEKEIIPSLVKQNISLISELPDMSSIEGSFISGSIFSNPRKSL